MPSITVREKENRGSGAEAGVQLGCCCSIQVREDDGWTKDGRGDGREETVRYSRKLGEFASGPGARRKRRRSQSRLLGVGFCRCLLLSWGGLGDSGRGQGAGTVRSWGSALNC